jgi:hypothetical protein
MKPWVMVWTKGKPSSTWSVREVKVKKFIIEVQCANQTHFKKRALFYTKKISEYLQKPIFQKVFDIATYNNLNKEESPFNISLKASNLTNQSFYYLNFNNEQTQSFRPIPLIQRNVFVSLRYEI